MAEFDGLREKISSIKLSPLGCAAFGIITTDYPLNEDERIMHIAGLPHVDEPSDIEAPSAPRPHNRRPRVRRWIEATIAASTKRQMRYAVRR
jgi:hypothetical protein